MEAKNEIFCSLSSRILERIGIDFEVLKENGIQLQHYLQITMISTSILNGGSQLGDIRNSFIPNFFESLTSVWQFGGRE